MKRTLVFLSIFLAQILSAQPTGTIKGKVTDEANGQPLPGANVLVAKTSLGAATNTNGEYLIPNVPAGTYDLKISHIGYVSAALKKIKVEDGKTTTADVKMKPAVIQGQEIKVMKMEMPVVMEMSISSQMSISPSGQLPGRYNPNFHTEAYDKINENEFLDAIKNPLSTFSIDVDAASYSNVRRFINQGQMPPPDAVRIEELVNYFTYYYPDPAGEHPFSFTTEVSTAPWNSGHSILLIGIQGKRVGTQALPPSNLVFLLDVSGSMQDPQKLPLVKSAFHLLVNQLRPEDRVSIVVYAGSSGVALEPTSGQDKQKILEAIDRLEAGGSTAGGAGIQLAYKIAKENFIRNGNNRVILATDGDFNIGASSDADMVNLIEEKRKDGIYLSVLGFGMGNYKDSKIEKLADHGNGNYAYIDNLLEAKKVFVGQMAGTLFTIAKDVKIQIEFNPAKVKAYRLIGYENRLLSKEDFNDDRKDAGELGAGHTVTALYEIIPAGASAALPAVDSLKYQNVKVRSDAKTSAEFLTLKFRYKLPQDTVSKLIVTVVEEQKGGQRFMSENLSFAGAVAEWGMLLRDSKFKGNSSFDDVLRRARQAKGNDEEGYRAEFIRLVELSKSLPKYSIEK